MSTAIDLSRLPPPDVVEVLDHTQIVAELVAAMSDAAPELADVLALESEPLRKLVEVFAYREALLRNRVNQASKSVLLATATGADLDHLAALFAVERLVLVEADPDAEIEAVLESDEDLRRRVQLAPEGATAAGTVGSYTFHALSSDPRVADATAAPEAPNTGRVIVTILTREGDGTPDPAMLVAVSEAMEPFRPLCIDLQVQAPTVVTFDIVATLTVLPGPDAGVVLATAEASLNDYVERVRKLGRDVTRAAIIGALMQEGVHNVALTSPAADVIVAAAEVGHCTSVAIADGGSDV